MRIKKSFALFSTGFVLGCSFIGFGCHSKLQQTSTRKSPPSSETADAPWHQTQKVSEKNCEHDENTFRCVVFKRNYDGDTITVDIPNVHPLLGKSASVRVFGVDTPEKDASNDCERNAAKRVQEMVSKRLSSAKRVDLVNVKKDKYFRILAEVYADGESLSDFLVQKNVAVKYFGKTKEKLDWCELPPKVVERSTRQAN